MRLSNRLSETVCTIALSLAVLGITGVELTRAFLA